MIELIVGEKGKGKTKILLDKVNNEIKEANGNIVYLDKSAKHMYELNNRIRLIDVSGYPINNGSEFVGFICGIISQDHDLEQIYIDNLMIISKIDLSEVASVVAELDKLGSVFHVKFVVNISAAKEALPEEVQSKIILAV